MQRALCAVRASAHCPPLSRPHNLHYVECPPRKEALRAGRCAGSLIVIGPTNSSANAPRLRRPAFGAPPRRDRSLFL